MSTTPSDRISVSAKIDKSLARVWELYTAPEHITNWNAASPEWHCPSAENDLRTGGHFSSRMEARDGSMGFDFGGTYTAVNQQESFSYAMDDGRTCDVHFHTHGNGTRIDVTFDPDGENPVEMQRGGWQAILGNFKTYAESIGE